MLGSYDQQRELDRILAGEKPSDNTLSFPAQLARGFLSGLTFGTVKPYEKEGKGGVPETIANFAGSAAGFIPLMRGTGAVVAGAGKFLPSLLKTGVEAGTAASKISKFAPYSEALSLPGQITNVGLASG